MAYFYDSAIGTDLRIQAQSTYTKIGTSTNTPLVFETNTTERARIDTSGNLLVNTTTALGKVTVIGAASSSSAYAIYSQNAGSQNLFYVRTDGYFVTGSGSVSPYNYTTANGANVFIDVNGGLLRSTSSLKYKFNVKDATHGLEDLLKLRSVTYNAKNDGDKISGGLIAEEVHEAGLTEFVQYAEDGSPDALSYGNMVALCIKAIQELKAELDELKAKVN
mgnify:CR=1 FL=1